MYSYLKGTVISIHPSYVIIENNGMGYHILIHCRLLGELPQLGETVQLHTTFVIREFSQALYGFLNSQERDVFEVLMNVTGIGPKLALSLLGHLTFDEMQLAVTSQDLSTLCKVPGVGKKTAERLIVELKDKLPLLLKTNFMGTSTSATHEIQSQNAQDALLALMNLGYNQNNAQKAIKQTLKDLPSNAELPLIITTALKYI